MAIPRRKVDPELQPIRSRGGRNLPNHVALATLPWARRHAIVRLPRRPQAESIMMFRDHHHVLRARRLDGLHPLVRIELCRMEHLRTRTAIPPLLVKKGIRSKVNDDAKLQVLPLRLLRSRLHIDGVLAHHPARTQHHQTQDTNRHCPDDRGPQNLFSNPHLSSPALLRTSTRLPAIPSTRAIRFFMD